MNPRLLLSPVQDYLHKNEGLDPSLVALKKSPFPEIHAAELAQQIAGRQKSKQKLPTWHATPGILFPPNLNLEQCSSEITAAYKSKLTSGTLLLDITGGFGIDSYYFSSKMDTVQYCEIQSELAALAAHNFGALGKKNIEVHNTSGIDQLRKLAAKNIRANWIYADPSRRDSGGGRVVNLEAYQPNIPAHLDTIFQVTDNLLVKTSPMLDLDMGLRALKGTREIHIVGVHNEVRELLWWVQPNYEGPVHLTALDLEAYPTHTFTRTEEQHARFSLAMPSNFLYEPHAALMKAGPFNLLCTWYPVFKLHALTHLYTSADLVEFPGRRFKIIDVLPYKAKKLPFKKANISTRNFPESVATIRSKTGIKPGGALYLFFVKISDDTLKVIVTEAV